MELQGLACRVLRHVSGFAPPLPTCVYKIFRVSCLDIFSVKVLAFRASLSLRDRQVFGYALSYFSFLRAYQGRASS